MSVMGILFYIILGGLMALATFAVYKYHGRTSLDWKSWVLAGIAIVLVAFGLAWAYTSMLEGEPRAAVMGIVMFSGTGVFFGFLSWWRARPAVTGDEQRIATHAPECPNRAVHPSWNRLLSPLKELPAQFILRHQFSSSQRATSLPK